jgi:hypothetical protein
MIRRWNLDGTGLTVVSDTSLPRQTVNNQVCSGSCRPETMCLPDCNSTWRQICRVTLTPWVTRTLGALRQYC